MSSSHPNVHEQTLQPPWDSLFLEHCALGGASLAGQRFFAPL